MTERKKTEVNLEMCSGFFRIPTDDIIYNITVLASNEPSTTKVVEKIIEVEKIVEVERKSPEPPVEAAPVVAVSPLALDDYFQKSARTFQQELTATAREAGTLLATGGVGPDLGAIQDLAAMAMDLKEVLLSMKGHPLLSGSGGSTGAAALAPALSQLATKIVHARSVCASSSALPSAPTTSQATKTVTRYLFNLDAVFQTIYELCTNETVKTHIQGARAKANEIFDKDIFYDAISPKASGYTEDDGFFTVPMTDIYTALGSACSDKAICNLLTKMDKQQGAIFLDQFLPLEVPEKAEVTIPVADDADFLEESPGPASTGNLTALLNECQNDIDALMLLGATAGGGQPHSNDDFLTKVEDAITIAARIHFDASRLAEEEAGSPSNDPTSLLGIKIKGLAILAETMLKEKETSPGLTYEQGLSAGQAALSRLVSEMTPKPKPQPPPPPPPPKVSTGAPPASENYGEASQDDIDRLLEELA
jgi:hypothetical protein